MKRIYINFADFWGGFDVNSNFLINTLSKRYEVVISKTPDYLFFSCFGTSHFSYNCVKILFLGENLVPDFNICDYAIGFDFMSFGDRYLRLPLYAVSDGFMQLKQKKVIDKEAVLNREFCSIVVSNKDGDPKRECIYKLLSEYKRVDSGGRAWNNIGGPVQDKLAFVSRYKFNIAFENSFSLGYTTEKIMEPMLVNTLPIYWGNPWIHKDFNPKSFINAHDFPTLEDLVEYIVRLDTSDDEYLKVLNEPWGCKNEYLDWENLLLNFVVPIIEKPLVNAKYLVEYGNSAHYRERLKTSELLYHKFHVGRLLALKKKIFFF